MGPISGKDHSWFLGGRTSISLDDILWVGRDHDTIRTMNSLSLPINARGQPPADVRVEFVREITLEDLPRAHNRTTEYPTIKNLKSIHHYMALLLASGKSQN